LLFSAKDLVADDDSQTVDERILTPEAQTALGVMYQNDQGVPLNYDEAGKWFRKAADQGFTLAQSTLSTMCATQTAQACLGIMPKR
jgi:TPR repeat protein